MNFQFYTEKAESSPEYEKFKKENPDAYLCAGFFVLVFSENEKDMHHLDYYLPKKHKIASFDVENMQVKISEIKKIGQIQQKADNKERDKKQDNPQEIKNEEVKVDLSALKGIVEDEMKNHTITDKLSKIIAILQKQDNKLVWNLNCITLGFGIIKVHVADEDSSILKFEKANLMDFVKKV